MLLKMLIAFTVLIVGGIGIYNVNKVDPYVAPEKKTTTVVEEKEVDPVDVLVREAINASSSTIQEAAQSDFDATVLRMEQEIELMVRKDDHKKGELKIEELEKKVGVY